MAAGTDLLLRCDELWAFGDERRNEAEIAAAEQAKIPVKYHPSWRKKGKT
jgi:hypothetical protein